MFPRPIGIMSFNPNPTPQELYEIMKIRAEGAEKRATHWYGLAKLFRGLTFRIRPTLTGPAVRDCEQTLIQASEYGKLFSEYSPHDATAHDNKLFSETGFVIDCPRCAWLRIVEDHTDTQIT